jgi:hypothetical protein
MPVVMPPSKRGRKPVARERKKISRNLYMTDATKDVLDRLSAESGVTASELVTALVHAEDRRRRELGFASMEA